MPPETKKKTRQTAFCGWLAAATVESSCGAPRKHRCAFPEGCKSIIVNKGTHGKGDARGENATDCRCARAQGRTTPDRRLDSAYRSVVWCR